MKAPRAATARVPVALLSAALLFGACETVFGLALRWYHAPLYYALSLGLTVGAALGLAAGLVLLRVPTTWALVVWAALCAGISEGWSFALLIGGAAALSLRVSAVGRCGPALLGALAGSGLVLALLRGPGAAAALGLRANWGEALGASVLFALVFAVGPLLFARLERRVEPRLQLALLTVLALVLAARPALEAPTGKRRLPPAGYASQPPAAESKPHVFLLVLDTVRADHLSVYGYRRDTTPQLAWRVAERPNAVVFPQAYANGTWTVPSHASLFTGLPPNEHGAHFATDGTLRLAFGLRDETPTLAEGMQAAGYATLGSFSNNWLRTVVGLGRGFDRYFLSPNYEPLPFVGEKLRYWLVPGIAPEAAKGGARAADVNATLLSMVRPWSRGPKPLFVFGNYGDAHGPYAPPPGFRGAFFPARVRERAEHLSLDLTPERIRELEARYDEELLYLDSELGRFFETLDSEGILDHSWVFVTSDHGEAFGEHGVLEHGTTVHNEVCRIPLVVFPPVGETLPLDEGPVSLIDVAHTIAAIAGAELPGTGRDLREPRSPGHHVAIEFYGDAHKALRHGELAREPSRAVVLGSYKLVERAGRFALHDLAADPGEENDLSAELPELVEELRSLLPEYREPHRPHGRGPSAADLRDLETLGYGGGGDP